MSSSHNIILFHIFFLSQYNNCFYFLNLVQDSASSSTKKQDKEQAIINKQHQAEQTRVSKKHSKELKSRTKYHSSQLAATEKLHKCELGVMSKDLGVMSKEVKVIFPISSFTYLILFNNLLCCCWCLSH